MTRATTLGGRMERWARKALRSSAVGVNRCYARPTSLLRVLPDYLVIGTQRGGTTSLYKYLNLHPGIGRPHLSKGVHYFDTNFTKGVAWYRSHFPTVAYREYVRRRWHLPLVVGEGSPYYMFHPAVPGRIAAVLPDVKLLVLLRNPVDRAYSHYQHEVARGFENLSFEEAIENEEERLAGEVTHLIADATYRSFHHQHHSYLARGAYVDQLRVLFSLFPRDQLLVLKSEGFFRDPAATLRSVFHFLGLPPLKEVSFDRFNAESYQEMAPSTRKRLAEYYEPSNRRLAEELGIDMEWSL